MACANAAPVQLTSITAARVARAAPMPALKKARREFKTKFLQVLSLEEFYQLLEETEAFYKNKIEI